MMVVYILCVPRDYINTSVNLNSPQVDLLLLVVWRKAVYDNTVQ